MAATGPPELGDLIGEGATAHVFAAAGAGGTDVVVKLLKPGLARDVVVRSRFLREARAASQVVHPRLVPVLAFGETGDQLWLTMPRMEGGTLSTRLKAGPLELAQVARLAEDLAGGLDALHRGGIVHRDVKPSNVLFDVRQNAHLSDFGLAKGSAWTALTSNGAVLGTPQYTAPELIAGEEATAVSDIYSLGCVLWEAATGAPPFEGLSFLGVGLAHLSEPPPEQALPADIGFALRAALEKDPHRRPSSAHALAAMVRVAAISTSSRA